MVKILGQNQLKRCGYVKQLIEIVNVLELLKHCKYELAHMLNILYNRKMRLIFKNEVICFTGKSKYVRHEMEKLAIKNGATITKNITSKTSLLIMGLRPGSKLDRAFSKDIKLMIDDEFLSIIND